MKAIFLVYRLAYYRYFTPLIKEGLRRGYEIECWHDYSQPRTGKKGHSFPDTRCMHTLCGLPGFKTRIFHGSEELENFLSKDKEIDIVFSIHMSNHNLKNEVFKNLPFRWARIMTGADSFFEFEGDLAKKPQPSPKETFFTYSDNWLERGRTFLNRFYPDYSNFLDGEMKCINVGTVEFDAFGGIDKDKIREKYEIPREKQILLYLPFPYDNRARNSSWERAFCGMFTNTAKTKEGVYLHNKKMHPLINLLSKAYSLYRISQDKYAWECWKSGANEKEIFKSVREYCDKNNLYLVVKPRLKFPVAEIVKNRADLVVWDDESQQDPPILKELLSVAGLTLSFFSSSVLTSASAGVFHLNVRLPSVFFENDRQRFWISDEKETHFNFKGVCESWPVEDVIKKLKDMPIDHFRINPEDYSRYIDKHIGLNDRKASRRVFDYYHNL